MRTIFETLLSLLESGADAVLATIVSAQGSTPRGVGSQLLAGPDGLAAGTIGGGPAEAQALDMAAKLLAERRSAVWTCELRHGGTLDSVCGGEQTILLQFIPHENGAWKELAREAAARLEAHLGGWVVLHLEGDPAMADQEGRALVGQVPQGSSLKGGCAWDGKCLTLPLPVGERVVIFGGGHCALALAPVLRSVGFRVAVFDDRPEFASAARFPEAETVVCRPYTDISAGLALTPEDYAVVMTSGHSHDFEVEEQLLRRPLAYVGVMGSRTKTAYVNGRLREAGISEEAIRRVRTPIGTAIKAVTPEEIAISVTGELIYERALRREAAGAAARMCPSHL